MEEYGSRLAAIALVAVAVTLPACNRVQASKSEQAVTGVASQPTPHNTQPSLPSQSAPAPTALAPSPSQPAAAPTAQSVPKVVASDRAQTLTVAQQLFRLLTHVETIEGTGDATVEWWELRDPKDHVVYREAYPLAFENGQFESTVAISASSFTTDQGSGILIHGYDLPSAPEGGGWVRLFGFKYGRDKYGADESLFGPFGPPIVIDGEFLDVGSDPLRPTPLSPAGATGGATVTVMHDILKFRLWTGNFNIVYPVLVNWITGKLQPAWHCLERTSKGSVDRCSYPITVEASRGNQPTFVRLFPEPDDSVPKHVIVQPESKIEYLEARTPIAWREEENSISFAVNGDVWIKVRIDGVEGWIHTQEDFDAVGLPQSD